MCVNIETAASIDANHRMSRAICGIAKTLRRRRNRCVLFAQVAQTAVAQAFWKGRLTHTKRAAMMNGLISVFNKDHKIYADTDDMAVFFE